MSNRISPVGADSDASYAFGYSADGVDYYLPVQSTPPVEIDKTDNAETVITAQTGRES